MLHENESDMDKNFGSINLETLSITKSLLQLKIFHSLEVPIAY